MQVACAGIAAQYGVSACLFEQQMRFRNIVQTPAATLRAALHQRRNSRQNRTRYLDKLASFLKLFANSVGINCTEVEALKYLRSLADQVNAIGIRLQGDYAR